MAIVPIRNNACVHGILDFNAPFSDILLTGERVNDRPAEKVTP